MVLNTINLCFLEQTALSLISYCSYYFWCIIIIPMLAWIYPFYQYMVRAKLSKKMMLQYHRYYNIIHRFIYCVLQFIYIFLVRRYHFVEKMIPFLYWMQLFEASNIINFLIVNKRITWKRILYNTLSILLVIQLNYYPSYLIISMFMVNYYCNLMSDMHKLFGINNRSINNKFFNIIKTLLFFSLVHLCTSFYESIIPIFVIYINILDIMFGFR